ncbi:hypothetical protein K2F54_14790 [Cryobacterium sp. 1639]|uniref:hypothetical protein n=1 Tax=Cryobacterium inferilacus TaxID=2866629 RepID=UPI001C735348|nr:hypothetical protein [Cryobacterium sp. 1639]MBX0301239.1 hypothetical protein [Cryobacterium sp. 1639]
MTFVAAAVTATQFRSDPDARVLADAEDILVRVLFDDIVRTLLRPTTGRIPASAVVPVTPVSTAAPPVAGSRDRRRPAWARSPPGEVSGRSGRMPT